MIHSCWTFSVKMKLLRPDYLRKNIPIQLGNKYIKAFWGLVRVHFTFFIIHSRRLEVGFIFISHESITKIISFVYFAGGISNILIHIHFPLPLFLSLLTIAEFLWETDWRLILEFMTYHEPKLEFKNTVCLRRRQLIFYFILLLYGPDASQFSANQNSNNTDFQYKYVWTVYISSNLIIDF